MLNIKPYEKNTQSKKNFFIQYSYYLKKLNLNKMKKDIKTILHNVFYRINTIYFKIGPSK